MRRLFLIAAVLATSSAAHAIPISSFESGLTGWDFMGDVSIQNASIGISPTQGQQMAFVSTMCNDQNPPSQVPDDQLAPCNTTVREHPYSGVSSPATQFSREFLGLPSDPWDFEALMPVRTNSPVGESGAMKTSFYAPQAGLLEFDWNHVGDPGDSAYFSLWSADPESSFRTTDWIYAYYWDDAVQSLVPSAPSGPSDVQICARYYGLLDDPLHPTCGLPGSADYLNQETGWFTKSVEVPTAGWYEIGFGLGEIQEGTVPSVLALDNVRFVKVLEPSTLGLFVGGLFAAAFVSRSRPLGGRARP